MSPYYLGNVDNEYGLSDELSVCVGTVEHYRYQDHFNAQMDGLPGAADKDKNDKVEDVTGADVTDVPKDTTAISNTAFSG